MTIDNNIVINIQDLSYSYGKKKIYSNLNIEIKEGIIFGLLGKNGVGKSTLINILMGFLKPLSKKCEIFAAKKIFGKVTNIKPFDLGYLILDNDNKLFNLKKYDNKLELKQIIYDKDIKIDYIHISENRKKEFSGYAIDKNSNFIFLSEIKFEE